MKVNSIERDIHLLESYAGMTHKMNDNQGRPKLDQAIEHILSDYKRVLKENEELNIRLQEEINEKCKLKTELYLNSIPKSVIEDKIDVLEKIQKEFKNNEELRIKIITYKELLNKGE